MPKNYKKRKIVNWYEVEEEIKKHSMLELSFIFPRFKKLKRKIRRDAKVDFYGTSVKMHCPFHREKTPSMSFSLKGGSYHCYGCGASGSIIDFWVKWFNIEYSQAVIELARIFKVKFQWRYV